MRKPTMYLNRRRICRRCGNNRTCDKIINHVQWHRDVDEQGKWTGKYLCSTCYSRERRDKLKKEIESMRKRYIEERNNI